METKNGKKLKEPFFIITFLKIWLLLFSVLIHDVIFKL